MTTMALLVSPSSFEAFYVNRLGLDRTSYVHEYRNDFVWSYTEGLRANGVDVITYMPSIRESGIERAADGFATRFLKLPAWWPGAEAVIDRARTPVERYAAEALGGKLLSGPIAAAAAEDGVDVLYVQEYWTGRFDVLARSSAIPVVAGEHGGSSGVHVHVGKSRTLRRAAAITVQSTNEQRRLRRYGIEPVLITNGVDVEFFRPGAETERRPKRILTVARLADEQKRISDLIKALALLPGDWSLEIVGSGPDEWLLRELAEQEGVAERVDFAGWVADREELRERYQRAGVFSLPSTWEAVTLAMLEAMACGTPAVVTPLPAFRDVIRDGENGLLVPVGAPAALAGALAQAHAGGQRLGVAARATVEASFDRRMTLKQLADVVRTAASPRGA